MNRFEGPGAAEASIKYLDGDFQVLTAGTFVTLFEPVQAVFLIL